jgi:hypothetical protein
MGAVYLMLALLFPRLKSITGLFVRKAWSQCNRRLRFNSYILGKSSQVRWTIARFLCGVQQRLAQREAENDDQPNVKLSRNSEDLVLVCRNKPKHQEPGQECDPGKAGASSIRHCCHPIAQLQKS